MNRRYDWSSGQPVRFPEPPAPRLLRSVLVFLAMLAVSALLSVDDIDTGPRPSVVWR